jgi:hypothetical protein
VATGNALESKPGTPQGTMLFDCLFCITGTGGVKTALPAHDGAKNKAVRLDQQYQDGTHFFAIFRQQSSICSRSS